MIDFVSRRSPLTRSLQTGEQTPDAAAALMRIRFLQALVLAAFIWPLVFGCATDPATDRARSALATGGTGYNSPVMSRAADHHDTVHLQPVIRVRLVEIEGHDELTIVALHAARLTLPDRNVPLEAGTRLTIRAALNDSGQAGLSVLDAWMPADHVQLTPTGDPAGAAFQIVAGNAKPLPVRAELTVWLTSANRLDAVVKLGMEDYVRGSVLAEMPASFGAEALKAQAVAIRTYGLYQLLGRSADPNARYDVQSSVADLRYGGVPYEKHEGDAATDATRGRVLTFNGRLFLTYFHSTCGGATLPAWQYFNAFRNLPPLAGANSPESNDSPMTEWKLAHPWSEIREKLLSGGLGLTADALGTQVLSVARIYPPGMDDIPHPLTPDPARRPLAYRFETNAGTVDIAATVLRRTIGGGKTAMPSTCCVIVPDGDQLQFIGRGWGHGAGMCQFGARGMARDGASYSSILSRYYPQSTLVCWYTD